MDGLEPSRFMVKKQSYLIDEEYKKLIIHRDQQKPFIAEKESELNIVDTEYLEIHDQKESLQQDKNIKMEAVEFSRMLTRYLQSSHFIKD